MAAGDFTASQIDAINLKVSEAWEGSQIQQEYIAYAEAARAILENQTARLAPLTDRNKDYDVNVMWLDPCAAPLQDCAPACNATGPQTESDSVGYDLPWCKEYHFSVAHEVERTNYFTTEEQIIHGKRLGVKALDEWIAQQALIALKGNAGINVYPTPWTFDPVAMTTEVPESDYNIKMIGNLKQQARKNRITSPYIIENGTLEVEWWNKVTDGSNLDGKGDDARTKVFKMYFDDENFSAAGLTEEMFIVDKSAVAILSKNSYADGAKYIAGNVNHWVYTIDSQLPGIKYDVIEKLTCVASADGKGEAYVSTFVIRAKAGMVANPKGCPITLNAQTYNRTGVISYSIADAA